MACSCPKTYMIYKRFCVLPHPSLLSHTASTHLFSFAYLLAPYLLRIASTTHFFGPIVCSQIICLVTILLQNVLYVYCVKCICVLFSTKSFKLV